MQVHYGLFYKVPHIDSSEKCWAASKSKASGIFLNEIQSNFLTTVNNEMCEKRVKKLNLCTNFQHQFFGNVRVYGS